MDGELPPWNKHGSHNSRAPCNTSGEHQEVGYSNYISVHYDKIMTEKNYVERAEEFSHNTWLRTQTKEHDVIEDNFAAGEPMTSLSSCMSGAFKALLPDYHGTSSAMSTNSDKYSCSPDNHCHIKPGTVVDEKIAVDRREESDFLKDSLGETSASVTHLLPLRCAQYVTHEKNRELDQGNSNWTSVIKDALEMSNGMEMEQTLSMDECGPLMDYNPINKVPETEANFRLKDPYQIAGSKLNEKQDGQGIKEEPGSFISVLSDDISKNKDVLEMCKHEEPSLLEAGSSLGKEELGITGIREHEPGLLPRFNRSSYTPFSSSESLMKSEQFPGIPLDNQSVDHTLQGTTQECGLSCKDVSPRKTANKNTGFKHAKVNNEIFPERSTIYGLLHLQKGCHRAEDHSQDHYSQCNVQDERVKTSNLHVYETTVIKHSAAYLPNSQYSGSKLKKQVHDLELTPASVGSQNTAVVECENLEQRIPTEERISENCLSVPGKIETNDFQETPVNTKTELSLKIETKFAPEIQNSSLVPDLPHRYRILTDYKCKDSQFEPVENVKLNELCFKESNSKNVTLTLASTSAFTERTTDECDIHVQEKQTPASLSAVLLPINENSERSEKVFLNITSESSIPPSTENVQAAPLSPTSMTDCSSQHNLQKALQRHKKARTRKKSELEALKGSKSNKRDDCSMYGSEILDSAVKLDKTGCEDANQNLLLADHDSTAPKEKDLITNGDENPPAPRKKCQMAKLELVADTTETSQKPDHSCSEASQEEVPSNEKAVSRKKLKKKTRLYLKAKNSATLSNQCLSQSTVLSPEDDCTSHFQVSDSTPMKGVSSNPAVIQHAISSLESSPEKLQKSRKKTTKQTLQSKDDPHKDVPTTFSELEEDVKMHQKVRRFPIKASKEKNKNASSLLDRQCSLDFEGQTDSVSTSVTESSNILSPRNNPKKSKQKKKAHINKAAKTPNVCPQESMENMMTSKTKTVKAKSSLKKATRTDDNETTLLDTQPSTATVKEVDSVSNVGNEVESPVILSTRRKSPKKKLSDIKCEAIHIPSVDQTTAQQSVLNPLSESDVSIVQPTTKRFRTRKTLDKKDSHNTVSENCEAPHLNLSSVDSVYATDVSQQNTEKTSSKRRKTDIKFIEAQTSTTGHQDDVTLPPSEDFSSIVVSNPEEAVKAKGFSRNKTNEETPLLATVTQESSILPAKIDCSSSFRLSNKKKKKPRKKAVTKIKNEAAEILIVNQHEDLAAVPSKSGANIIASSSQMTSKEKRTVEKAIRQEVKDDHAVTLFEMQSSTLTLQQTEHISTSVHSTAKKSKKMSGIKREAVYTPAVHQTMQQEIHPFHSTSATEMDHSDVLKQKKTKVKMKTQPKKATKRKTHSTQAISDIREQSTVQQGNSVSNRKINPMSEGMRKKCMKKRTSALKFRNDQPQDHAEHSTVLSPLMPPPVSQSKDATHDITCIKRDNVNETAESHVENQVSITTKDVASPQSSLKKAKKTKRKQLLEQKEENEQSNFLVLAHRENKMSDVPSVVRGVASENFETDSCDQNLKVAKKKSKKSIEIAETHGFTSDSLSQEKNTGSEEAGVMVTFTQVEDFCKPSDSQTVGSQQPEKDDVVVDQKDLKATKNPKKRGRKPGRKKRKMACLLTQTIKEEEHKDICYDNRIACDFQNNTQIQISEISQRITDTPEEPVLKSRKSTRTQKINAGPVVENLLTQGRRTVSLDITECHTTHGETLSSSVQTADCEDQYTVEKKPPRRGRPPSKKSKKQKLFVAHLEDNTSPSVQISDLSLCQDSTENTVKAAASPIKQKDMDKNVIVTKQLGTDPSESLHSAADLLSHSIPISGRENGKNLKRPIRDQKLSSLRVSSRTSETSVKGFQKADITTIPQNSTDIFNEEGKISLPMPGTVKKQKLCEKTAIQDGDVLPDIKIENKTTIKVLKGRKRGRKRRKIKDGQLQRLKTQDYCEPAKSLLTKFNLTSKCSTEDQNNIVTPEKNDNEKTELDSVEMIPPIPAGTCKITPKTDVLCSSSTELSSNIMKKVKKYKVKEQSAEPSGKDSFEVSMQSYTDSTGVSKGICSLISSNVVKEESEQISLDTKMKPNIELKFTQETDGLSVETSGKKVLDNSSEPENGLQPSTEWKVDCFRQDSEDSVVMPNKVTNNMAKRFKPKEILKKPLTCKYCGVSFRHITAYTIHRRIHTGDKPYKCKICGKTFAQLSKLKSHHNIHKQDTSFPCPCCSRRFLQKDDLLFHFKIHLQESKANSKPQKHIKSKRNTSSNVSLENPNNYGCLICKKNFVNHVKLQNHMQEHKVEKPMTCKDCGKTFWKQSSLIAHEKTHWPVKPYACSICGKGFNQLKSLKKHSQDHAGETPFSCFHCSHGFSALSALRTHQASKTCIARRNDEANNNIEGFIVSQGVDGQVNTPVFFKCPICKQLFRKWCQYTLHLQTHTSSPPYICFSCGQCYEKDSEMNVHCEVCCQSSGEEEICGASLAEIMQGVTQTYPLKCTSSQTLPSVEFQLNSQMPTSSEQLPQLPRVIDVEQTRDTDLSKLPKTYSAHSPIKLPNTQSPTRSYVNCTSPSSSRECIEISQSLWKFKCSRCGQRFERYRTLSAHLQTHAPGFRYTCAHCGQFFERWSKLWLHQQRHHRLKSRCYSCMQCNLQFRFFSSFREHMIYHAGQRSYVCLLCPKTFIQEASLHAHQCESHKRCKSLKCDVCSKTFSGLTNLIKHSLLHNGSTSHICLLCNLSFTNTKALKEHLKTHTTYHEPALPDIPSKPLDFPHKCKRCKASFSTGDLLYAHQIRHSRDAKTQIRPVVVPTSKLSNSCHNDTPSTPPSTHRNHISNLKLDGIPSDNSLYVYSHPDKLYVSPSCRVQLPVINLDPDEPEEVSDSQNPGLELPNSEITSQSDSTHLPQATSDQETANLNSSESMKMMANGQHNYSLNCQRSPTFVETSVDMEVETPAQEEESEESFECADCTEKLTSVLGLYEHYILHAMGDAYVQVH